MHADYFATAPRPSTVTAARPRLPHETAGRTFRQRCRLWQAALQSLECATNIVSQLLEPRPCASLAILKLSAIHASSGYIFTPTMYMRLQASSSCKSRRGKFFCAALFCHSFSKPCRRGGSGSAIAPSTCLGDIGKWDEAATPASEAGEGHALGRERSFTRLDLFVSPFSRVQGPELTHCFADRHGGSHGYVERAQAWTHWNNEPSVSRLVHLPRHA